MFKLFKKANKKQEEVRKIEKGGYVVYKYTNNFECGTDEEIVAIFEEEEEAWKAIEEMEEEEKELGHNNVTFDYVYEEWS